LRFSRVLGFFFFGFRGPVGGFGGWFGCFLGAFSITWVTNGGFYCIVEVTIMLFRSFLVGSLLVFLGFFMWASWVASICTSCVFRGALRFF
jgi:hypothetical protein